MRLLRDILVWILLIVLAVISVMGAMVLFPTTWGPFLRMSRAAMAVVDTYRAMDLLFWVFVGLFFATVLTLMLTIRIRPARTQIEVQMKDGRVIIMDSAIKKYVRTALADVPGIAARRIDLRQKRGKLFVDILAQVRSHEPLPDIEERTIAKVKDSLSSHLGITQIGGVHVVISDLHVIERPETQTQPYDEPAPYRPSPAQVGAAPVETMAPRAEDRGDVVSLGLIAAAENEGMASSAAAAEALVPGGTNATAQPEAAPEAAGEAGDAPPRRGLFARWRRDKSDASAEVEAASGDPIPSEAAASEQDVPAEFDEPEPAASAGSNEKPASDGGKSPSVY